MRKYITHTYLARIARYKRAPLLLFLFAICSSTFIVFPTDLYLAFVVFYNKKRYLYYAFIAVLGSFIGGSLNYSLGYFLLEHFQEQIFSLFNIKEETFQYFSKIYLSYGFWILFLSNIPPIPHKLMCFIAGAFKLDIYIFFPIIIINRSLRYFTIAALTFYFRNRFALVLKRINYYLFILGIFMVIVILIILLLLKFYS